ncbi:MAG: UDP-N-acetylglucosamine 2-epimerase [Burkholderiaceae bacterium]|uniref:UDP-N-acetylglucosamine 2-epimerase n=1 Tax=Hydrogenophaga sp. TaxID=1904254 RepID=UPI00277A3F2A|nr:UDP-N-acetylglucosamine 2-epimerase [Hydrogenophaga sp.]MDP2066111.1 UDP-N-acetylglucosamine 2-epimerase [Burkholderiaceae bacterium]MDZ4143316.1 UDP-N-acetylglucosamine 2-epimerase [Burkholderiales bacterium]MDZ4398688.1 UDP-N-acetylglucosamine 2-epimerase [Hydrogenophaga sp.]
MDAQRATPRRRIMYLSGTRADFGLMRSTLQQASAHPGLTLDVAVTGTHLSPDHGNTVDEIQSAGFHVAAEIPVDVMTRTLASMASAVGECLKGMACVLETHRPDALVLLGDRGEMLAGAVAALHLGVPIVHIHGGERSGTVDEPVRHAISKLSTWHLVATEESAERLRRMGEDGQRIVVVGAPGLDGLTDLAAGTMHDTVAELQLPPSTPFVLALFHPVVQQADLARDQTIALMHALNAMALPVVWLEPNADAGALGVLQALDEGALPSGSRRVRHLDRALFVRTMRHAVVMVGNSSAGIIEAATFGTPVVNVGDRQRLRERNANVVDVPAEAAALTAALRQAVQHGRFACINRYGDGQAGRRIVEHLVQMPLVHALQEKTNAY